MRDASTAQRRRFEAVYGANYRRVHGYVARRLQRDAVDDATADVFAVAWRRRTDLPTEPIGWLLGVAANVIRQHYRARSRFDRLVDEERMRVGWAVVGNVEQEATDRIVSVTALLSLSAQDREAILLVAWEELTQSQAAVAAGCSPGTFRVRLTRARSRLRAALADADADHPTDRTWEKCPT